MLTHPTIEKLHALHLRAMATAFDQQRSASQYAELGFDDRFGLLVDTEWTAREQRRLTQRLRQAKLRYPASLEDVDFTPPRGLSRDVVLSLGTGEWIRDHTNPLISVRSSRASPIEMPSSSLGASPFTPSSFKKKYGEIERSPVESTSGCVVTGSHDARP
jgi:IstB-like ATP binding protein